MGTAASHPSTRQLGQQLLQRAAPAPRSAATRKNRRCVTHLHAVPPPLVRASHQRVKLAWGQGGRERRETWIRGEISVRQQQQQQRRCGCQSRTAGHMVDACEVHEAALASTWCRRCMRAKCGGGRGLRLTRFQSV